jgi:hypothetical protein
MSSFKQRLDGTWEEKGSLAESVSFAGGSERSSGTVFSGCDTTISAKSNLIHLMKLECLTPKTQNPGDGKRVNAKLRMPEP